MIDRDIHHHFSESMGQDSEDVPPPDVYINRADWLARPPDIHAGLVELDFCALPPDPRGKKKKR